MRLHDTREYRWWRSYWQLRVRAGGVRCTRGSACVWAEVVDGVLVGGFIHPNEPFDLGHDDIDKSVIRGPEHRRCNRRTKSHQRARRLSRQW